MNGLERAGAHGLLYHPWHHWSGKALRTRLWPDRWITTDIPAMEPRRLRVGQPITPEQFEELTDEQLARLVPRAYREYFPGKDFCADGHFYLHDGTAWSFYRGGFLDE